MSQLAQAALSPRAEDVGQAGGGDAAGAEVLQGDAVRFALEVAGVAQGHEFLRREGGDHAEGHIAGHGRPDHEQHGRAGGHAHAVPFPRMAEFVGEYGDQLLVVPGERHHVVGDDDDAAGQREGVRADVFAAPELEARLDA